MERVVEGRGTFSVSVVFLLHSKSSTGVDWFIVDTEHGAAVRIHRAVDYWAKHIVDQIKNTTQGGRAVSGGGRWEESRDVREQEGRRGEGIRPGSGVVAVVW